MYNFKIYLNNIKYIYSIYILKIYIYSIYISGMFSFNLGLGQVSHMDTTQRGWT